MKISELFTQSELKEKWNQLKTEVGLKLPDLVALDFKPRIRFSRQNFWNQNHQTYNTCFKRNIKTISQLDNIFKQGQTN